MSSFCRFGGGGRWMGKDLDVIGSWIDGVDDPGSFTGGGESTLSLSDSSSDRSDRYPVNISFAIASDVGHEGSVLGSGCMITSEVNSAGLGAFGGRRKLRIILALLLLQVEYCVADIIGLTTYLSLATEFNFSFSRASKASRRWVRPESLL
jgi:hypothetical protein